MRSRRFGSGALAAAILAACGGEAPTDVSPAASPDDPAFIGAAANTRVPMRGTYEASGTFGAPPDGCAGFYSTFEGKGVETHVGAYTIANDICTVPVDATHSTFSGRFTKIAASGDALYGTYAGTTLLTQAPGTTSPIGVFAIAGDLAFTGGTGRFVGATGGQRMEGTQTTDFSRPGLPSTIALSLDGTLSTVGSLR